MVEKLDLEQFSKGNFCKFCYTLISRIKNGRGTSIGPDVPKTAHPGKQ
jgi:hypothetical protein